MFYFGESMCENINMVLAATLTSIINHMSCKCYMRNIFQTRKKKAYKMHYIILSVVQVSCFRVSILIF